MCEGTTGNGPLSGWDIHPLEYEGHPDLEGIHQVGSI